MPEFTKQVVTQATRSIETDPKAASFVALVIVDPSGCHVGFPDPAVVADLKSRGAYSDAPLETYDGLDDAGKAQLVDLLSTCNVEGAMKDGFVPPDDLPLPGKLVKLAPLGGGPVEVKG